MDQDQSELAAGSGPAGFGVIRSNDLLFLGLMRSLAAASGDFVSVTYDWPGAGPWWSSASRHFANPIEISNPFDDASSASKSLMQQLKPGPDGRPPILLPSSDTSLMFMTDHESELQSVARLIGDPDFLSYRADVSDKGTCGELLRRAGVSIPVTVPVDRKEDIATALDLVPLPAVVKPAVKDYGQSFYRKYNGLKAISCSTRDELAAALGEGIESGFRLLAQEKIHFDSAMDEIPAYIYVDANQQPRVFVGAVKERIDPPPFGTATVLRLVDNEELLAPTLAVAKALKWRGMLMVEFIKDKKDGVWKVIEVNGRPWLMIDFFRRSGLDFVGALVDDVAGAPAPESPVRLDPGRDPLHIDVVEVINALAKEGNSAASLTAIERLFDAWPGDVSEPFLDPRDPRPGEQRFSHAASSWGLDASKVIETVSSRLGED